MTRHINQEGLECIKQWEGLRLEAYRDIGGALTIGYGHTNASGTPPKVYEGMIITQQEAERILRRDLRMCEDFVETMVTVPLTDAQFAALVSFCYNVGSKSLQNSTLLKKLNLGQYEAVPRELTKWTRNRGKVVMGLVNRRAAEAGLWVKGSYVASNYQVTDSSSVNYKSMAEMAAPVVTGLSGLGSLSMNNPPIQYALAFIMISGAVMGLLLFIRRMKEDRL